MRLIIAAASRKQREGICHCWRENDETDSSLHQQIVKGNNFFFFHIAVRSGLYETDIHLLNVILVCQEMIINESNVSYTVTYFSMHKAEFCMLLLFISGSFFVVCWYVPPSHSQLWSSIAENSSVDIKMQHQFHIFLLYYSENRCQLMKIMMSIKCLIITTCIITMFVTKRGGCRE